MSKQKKENTYISIHLKKDISCWFKLNSSISISEVIFLKRLFHTRKLLKLTKKGIAGVLI